MGKQSKAMDSDRSRYVRRKDAAPITFAFQLGAGGLIKKRARKRKAWHVRKRTGVTCVPEKRLYRSRRQTELDNLVSASLGGSRPITAR